MFRLKAALRKAGSATIPPVKPLFSGDIFGKKSACSKVISVFCWLNFSRLPARIIFSYASVALLNASWLPFCPWICDAISSFTSSRVLVWAGSIFSAFIIWKPNWVSTMPLISPSLNVNTASSKGFTILPWENEPRSPPLGPVGPSEYCLASSAKSSPELASSRTCSARLSFSLNASSDSPSVVFMRIWRALLCSGILYRLKFWR